MHTPQEQEQEQEQERVVGLGRLRTEPRQTPRARRPPPKPALSL